MKKANPFIGFKFGDVQLLDEKTFLDGSTSIDSFLKIYKTSETKRFIGYLDQLQNTELPPYDAFQSKLRSCNPLEAETNDYVEVLLIGMTTQQAVTKLELSKPPPTGVENYLYLQEK